MPLAHACHPIIGLGRDDVDGGVGAVNGRHYVPNANDVRTLDNFLRTDIHMDTPEGKSTRH